MRRARPLLGTIVDIAAEGVDEQLAPAIEAAFTSIASVQRLMSFHDPESDVSRINRAATEEEVSIDPQTTCVLEFANRLSSLSGGLFDVTTAAVLVDNGFLPEPDSGEVTIGVTYRDLVLQPGNRVLWRRKGWIDLGGIAKGYAVDCAISILRMHDVATAIVNAGGDLRCFGAPQPMHVRHPDMPATMVSIGSLCDAALATSAGYFSRIDRGGRSVEPLVDPQRRQCATWNGSISVAAADAMTADALTKIVRLAPDAAPGLLEHFDAQAIMIDREGARCCGRSLLHSGVAA